MPWIPAEEGDRPTLGHEIVRWIEEFIVVPDGPRAGEAFILSQAQRAFTLNLYELSPGAVVDRSRPSRAFVWSRGGQLVAPQKWGKGPFSAALVIAEAYAPVLFDGWDATGQPVGRPWPTPWIQVTAVSEDQTANVWRALIPMITTGGLAADIPDTGESRVNLPGGGRIEPTTASGRSRLGQRITFAVQDEAHDWMKRNGGRKLADTQRRNLAGMGGRFIETGNAWDPAEDSVAERTHEEPGVFKMMQQGGAGSIRNHRERMKVLKEVYAGSDWVDPERISEEIDALLERGELAQAERFFMNRIVPGEDRAFDLKRWDELANPGHTIPDKERIVIGVDGARYNDALAMIATDIRSGFQWVLGIWERPPEADEDYEHPTDEVDGAMAGAFEQWNVWRVYVDPGSQYANIAPLMEKWQGRWGKKITPWMMNRPRPSALLIRGYASAIITGDLSHDGDPLFRQHVANARRKMLTVYDEDGRAMHTIQKESPNSPAKIDAAAAGALSWEARGDAIAAGKAQAGGYEDPSLQCRDCGHLKRLHAPVCRVRPEGHCKAFVPNDQLTGASVA